MSRILQVNIDDLLRCRGVESARVEFKASWDENTTGLQILKTLCAFANDFHNLNGGTSWSAWRRTAAHPAAEGSPTEDRRDAEVDSGQHSRIDQYQPMMSPRPWTESVFWSSGLREAMSALIALLRERRRVQLLRQNRFGERDAESNGL